MSPTCQRLQRGPARQPDSALWGKFPTSITNEARAIQDYQLLSSHSMKHIVNYFLEQCITLTEAVEHYQRVLNDEPGEMSREDLHPLSDPHTLSDLHSETHRIVSQITQLKVNLKKQSRITQRLRKGSNIKTLQNLSEEVSWLSSTFMTNTLSSQGTRIAKIDASLSRRAKPSQAPAKALAQYSDNAA